MHCFTMSKRLFSTALLLVALSRLALVNSVEVNVYQLCFPTVTRSLSENELFTFEQLTDHFLTSEEMQSPDSFAMAQNWVPFEDVNASSVEKPPTIFIIDDVMATKSQYRNDACWTTSLQIRADDVDNLAGIWTDHRSQAIYMGLLRMGMEANLFVPAPSANGNKIVTTTTEQGQGMDTTTTTTTTTIVTTRKWTWLWITAGVLTIGSLTILVMWNIYLRPSKPPRYIRKNDSTDGTTDKNWPDHGEAEVEQAESSCSSFCTS